MRLFKFVGSKSAILNMAAGSLKFTPIAELNDPAELSPVMDRESVGDSLRLLRARGMSRRQFKWLRCQDATLSLLAPEEKVLAVPASMAEANRMLKFSAYDNLDYMDRKHAATIALIRERVGILSLSSRWDSLPMWAHYGSLAQGYVAILDNLDRSFPGDETGSLNVPKRVTYSKDLSGMTFDPGTQDRLFFSKLSDWSYEREWRVVTPLRSCEHVPDASLYLRKIDRRHFAGVICGWRVDEDERAALKRQVASINPGAQVLAARFENGAVALDGEV